MSVATTAASLRVSLSLAMGSPRNGYPDLYRARTERSRI